MVPGLTLQQLSPSGKYSRHIIYLHIHQPIHVTVWMTKDFLLTAAGLTICFFLNFNVICYCMCVHIECFKDKHVYPSICVKVKVVLSFHQAGKLRGAQPAWQMSSLKKSRALSLLRFVNVIYHCPQSGLTQCKFLTLCLGGHELRELTGL